MRRKRDTGFHGRGRIPSEWQTIQFVYAASYELADDVGSSWHIPGHWVPKLFKLVLLRKAEVVEKLRVGMKFDCDLYAEC